MIRYSVVMSRCLDGISHRSSCRYKYNEKGLINLRVAISFVFLDEEFYIKAPASVPFVINSLTNIESGFFSRPCATSVTIFSTS